MANENQEPIEEQKEETTTNNVVEEQKEVATTNEVVEEKTSEETPNTSKISNEERDKVLAELKGFSESKTQFEVEITSKTRGGFRVSYKDLPLFLPISHFSLKRKPDDSELENLEGQKLDVLVQDIKEIEGSTTIVVSRKPILESAIWDKLNVGDKVEGTVTSTPQFGIFLDIGGVEGLIHVSRISNARVEHPKDVAKKGDKLEALIIDLDKENKKIGLSRKELEPSLWDGVEQEFPAGSTQKGIVRRLTEFGAYVELKPGVDGLLRNGEISWTKRINHPSQVLKAGESIDVYVAKVNEEKGMATLSIKQLMDNPWDTLAEKYPIESVYHAEVLDINPKGVVFALNEQIDGFMPKSKLKSILKGNNIPYEKGEKVEVIISEIDPSTESLILTPKGVEQVEAKPRSEDKVSGNYKKQKGDSSFTIGDLLGENLADKFKDLN